MHKDHDINVKNAIILWVSTLGYMGIIFFLSSQQSFPIRGLPENADKAVHIFIYMPLAFLLYLSLHSIGLKKSVFAVAFIFAGMYGVTDEFHQYFVPGRYSSSGDVAADFIGAFLGSTGANHFIKSKFNFISQDSKNSDARRTTNTG